MRTSWIQLRSRPSHHLATGEEMKSWCHAQRKRIRVTADVGSTPDGVCPRQAQRVSSCRRYLVAKQWGSPTLPAAHPGSHAGAHAPVSGSDFEFGQIIIRWQCNSLISGTTAIQLIPRPSSATESEPGLLNIFIKKLLTLDVVQPDSG